MNKVLESEFMNLTMEEVKELVAKHHADSHKGVIWNYQFCYVFAFYDTSDEEIAPKLTSTMKPEEEIMFLEKCLVILKQEYCQQWLFKGEAV